MFETIHWYNYRQTYFFSSVCDRNIVCYHGAYTVERYNFNLKTYDDIQTSHITTGLQIFIKTVQP